MSEQQLALKEICSLLSNINRKYDEALAHLARISAAVMSGVDPKELSLTGVQAAIYELANGTRSTNEIAEMLKKTPNQIRTALGRLTKKGFLVAVGERTGVFQKTPILWTRPLPRSSATNDAVNESSMG